MKQAVCFATIAFLMFSNVANAQSVNTTLAVGGGFESEQKQIHKSDFANGQEVQSIQLNSKSRTKTFSNDGKTLEMDGELLGVKTSIYSAVETSIGGYASNDDSFLEFKGELYDY
jgi:hypothetical protein